MTYYKNDLGYVYHLTISISPGEICCLEPVVVQSLLRLGGKSINLWLDNKGFLKVDTFFSNYDSRENFCRLIDKTINSC